MFPETFIHKIFKTNSSFHVKYRTARKVSVFQEFFDILNKISFWQENWALEYHSMKFRHFPDIS